MIILIVACNVTCIYNIISNQITVNSGQILSEVEIGSLLNDSICCAIVDRSGWPVGQVINMQSIVDFISQMLIEELLDKSLSALKSILFHSAPFMLS